MLKISIIIGEFHKALAEEILTEARAVAKELEVEIVDEIWVPGSFEAPLALKRIIKAKKCVGAVILGVIEKGETKHGETIGKAMADKILDLSVDNDFPIGFGIIGPGATLAQAKERIGKTTEGAVRAVVKMINFA